MPAIGEVVHIVPLGFEIDRAVVPFDTAKADRVYLLSAINIRGADWQQEEKQAYYIKRVREKLEAADIEVICISLDLLDPLAVMKTVSTIAVLEKNKGNRVNINISAAGRLTSVAAAITGMLHDAAVYYVRAEKYSENDEEKREHGLSVCPGGETMILENIPFMLPEKPGLVVLSSLAKHPGDMSTRELLDVLQESGINGFAQLYDEVEPAMRRSVQTKQLMKLDKTILFKLENSGFVKKMKKGRNVYISLTERGRYIAHICGMMNDYYVCL